MQNRNTIKTIEGICAPLISSRNIEFSRERDTCSKVTPMMICPCGITVSWFLLQNSLPPLPPSPTPSTPPPMSAKASSSMTSYSPEDMLTEEEDEVAECILDFPREKLNIVENLGCGYFGDVHICEVDRFPGYDEVFRNTSSDLVIVKSLRPGSSDALR